MNFIKKIFDEESDDSVHKHFIKFGKGEYRGKFVLNLRKTKKIKIKTSFEFANDLVRFCSKLGDCKVSGIVLSKKDISNFLSEKNIEGDSEKKKGGLFYKNDILDQKLSKEQLADLEKESYFTLLDLEAEEFQLKIKKKLPKPGKSEKKIDDKFCQLEIDDKFYSKIKEDFFWDIPESKKVKISHTLDIKEIIYPKDEDDYAKIREMAKRKGKIIRKIIINDEEILSEKDFEV